MKKYSNTPVINDDRTLQITGDILTENIPFAPSGRQVAETVFDIMLRAAAEADSIENTCKTLRDAPSGKTVRTCLEQYGSVTETEVYVNHALQAQLPPRIRNGRQPVAIDYNRLPYYGNPSPEEAPYICKGKAESGTTRFYVYATLYVIRKGKRVTAALTSVKPDDTYVAVITRLLDKTASLNIKMKCLYADKAFFNVPVIRWLKALGIPFVIPVVIRGKKGGTRQLIRDKRTRKTVYTMESSEYGTVTFNVWIVCVYSKGKYGKHGTEVFAYAVNNIGIGLRGIFKDYRKRFGIETGYRLKNLCRIKTTVKNPAVRLLFVGLSFIIVNLWVYILWKYVSYPRKGGRLICRELFPLKLMLIFLREAVGRKHKTVNTIYFKQNKISIY